MYRVAGCSVIGGQSHRNSRWRTWPWSRPAVEHLFNPPKRKPMCRSRSTLWTNFDDRIAAIRVDLNGQRGVPERSEGKLIDGPCAIAACDEFQAAAPRNKAHVLLARSLSH